MNPSAIRLLGLLLLALAYPLAASGQNGTGRLPAPFAQALQQAGIPESAVGLYIQDTRADQPLIALGDERPLNPASTIKLVTTFAALTQLGPAYRWTTEVYTSAPVQGGVLAGDLIIKGAGDPHLTLENFWLMLRELRGRGVREIRGDLVIDSSYFAAGVSGDAASFDNEPTRPYNTPPSALLVNFKAVRLQFLPVNGERRIAIVAEPALPQIEVLNNVAVDDEPCGDWVSRLTFAITGDESRVRLLFGGRYSSACGPQERNYSVLGHRQYTHALFTALWRELGDTFNGGARESATPPGAQLLLGYRSQPLADTVRDINKFSNNLMARELFLDFGAIASGAPATLEKSISATKQALTLGGISLPELVLENGSGLSRNERISARGMGRLLLTAQRSAVMPEFVASLPIVALDGTMRRRLTDAQIAGQAHIKTGTLNGARALAGYVLDNRGRTMIVVCIINHPRAQAGGAAQDALLNWIYTR